MQASIAPSFADVLHSPGGMGVVFGMGVVCRHGEKRYQEQRQPKRERKQEQETRGVADQLMGVQT